jgi:hypothetical protein
MLPLQFSKDDALDLDFVTAATNLRAAVFSIPLQSKFDVKSIAGNIIPAISTTNAVVAGLQVGGRAVTVQAVRWGTRVFMARASAEVLVSWRGCRDRDCSCE